MCQPGAIHRVLPATAVLFLIITVLGRVPSLATVLGWMPIFGADVALHALSSVGSAYFGWLAPELRERPRFVQRAR
jgi:hypothetical protein